MSYLTRPIDIPGFQCEKEMIPMRLRSLCGTTDYLVIKNECPVRCGPTE